MSLWIWKSAWNRTSSQLLHWQLCGIWLESGCAAPEKMGVMLAVTNYNQLHQNNSSPSLEHSTLSNTVFIRLNFSFLTFDTQQKLLTLHSDSRNTLNTEPKNNMESSPFKVNKRERKKDEVVLSMVLNALDYSWRTQIVLSCGGGQNVFPTLPDKGHTVCYIRANLM